MAKYLQIFILFILVSNISYGQQVSVGVKGGLNYSYQTWRTHPREHPTLGVIGDDSRRVTKSNTGIKLGVFADITFSKFLSFAPGILYNEKGLDFELLHYNYDQEPRFSTTSNKVNLQYISVDAPLKLRLEKKQWIPYALVGTRIDALLSYKQSASKEVLALVAPGHKGYKEIYEQLNKVNVGLLTAIGVERKLSKDINLFLEIEHNLTRSCNKPWGTINNTTFALNGGIRWTKN